MRKLICLPLLFGIGCMPASTLPSVDNTFGSYTRALAAREHAMGQIPRTLERPESMDLEMNLTAFTAPPMWNRAMVFDGLKGEDICFQEWESDVDQNADAEERGKQHFEDIEARVELLAELPNGRALWPSSGPKLAYRDVAEDETKIPKNGGLPERTIYWRTCGPVPQPPAGKEARYLAVIVHHAKPIGHSYPDDELLLWELK